MQYDNLQLFAKYGDGTAKWEGECELWDMDWKNLPGKSGTWTEF